LSQWVSNQGFWFQLRYSLSGSGDRGILTFHALRLLARIGVFLVILAAGAWVYLFTFTKSEGYVKGVSDSLQQKLAAQEIKLEGVSREQGEFQISRMAMLGGDDTFFTSLEARDLRCEMGLFDTFTKEWDPGMVEISRADVSLRAGADSEASANAIGDVIFQDVGRVKVDAIQVNDMSVRWGYSKRTRGEISGSKMTARRTPDGWSLTFRGGKFSQNWLKRLDIEELDVVFGAQGIVFEKAVFKKADGMVIFTNLKVESGDRPKVSGEMELRNVDLSLLFPAAVRGFVEGRISGNFDVIGSTNSSDGIGFKGVVYLDGDDAIILRDRVHLLRALSVIDAFNNYRRVNFTRGSFSVTSHAGRLEIQDVDLSAGELMTLKGDLVVRTPTSQEVFDLSERDDFSNLIFTDDELDVAADSFTLQEAAELAARERKIGFKGGEEDSLFDKIGSRGQTRRLEQNAAERLTRSYRYEGKFAITLSKEAFARAPKLATNYPVSEQTGRIPLEVPIEGLLYDITINQADEIYRDGSR